MIIPQSPSIFPRQFINRPDVETCVSQGFHVGILGAVLVLVLFIQSVFVTFGRSSIPPWGKSSKRGSMFWEVLKTAIILTFNVVSLVSGIWLLIAACSFPDSLESTLPDIPEEVNISNFLWMFTIARVVLAGIGGLTSMILGTRRVLAVRAEKDDIPPCRKTIMLSNILMGIAGWAYLVPLVMGLIAIEFTDQSTIKIFSIVYWAVIVLITLILLFGGIFAKLTQVKSMGWNLLIAIIFIGGFACAIYSEIFAGLAVQSLFLLPVEDRAVLSWVHVGGAIIAHWLMGG